MQVLDAEGHVYYYADEMTGIASDIRAIESVLQHEPELATLEVAKNVTASEWLEKAKRLMVEGRAEKEKMKPKYFPAMRAWEQAIKDAVKGDRKKLMAQHGRPSYFDRMHEFDARGSVAHVQKASWFRYDQPSGCQVFYYFKGHSISKTERQPKGCQVAGIRQ